MVPLFTAIVAFPSSLVQSLFQKLLTPKEILE